MPKSELKCPKCGRAFALAMHLARHMNASHAAKGSKKPAPKKRGRRKKTSRSPRASHRVATGPGESLGENLQGLLQAHREKLVAQHAALGARLAGLSQALQVLGAPSASKPARRRKSRGKKRGVRKGSLPDFIGRVLRQTKEAVSPRDIAARVLKAGYKSKSKNLTNMVSNALAGLPGVSKLGRGLYRGS